VGFNCALITGSSRGLGKALALSFASHGWGVVAHGRNKDRVAEVKGLVLSKGVQCESVVGDITEMSTVLLLANMTRSLGVSVLVNNAGVYTRSRIDELNSLHIQKVINTNLLAPILLTQKVFEVFKESKSGLVININSVAGKVPSPYESVYCASKFGLRGFMESFKYEALKCGVAVSDVYLGAMATFMTEGRDDRDKFISVDEAAEAVFGLVSQWCMMGTLRVGEIDLFRRNY